MSKEPAPVPPPPQAIAAELVCPRPWGVGMTLVWGLAVAAVSLLVQTGVLIALLVVGHFPIAGMPADELQQTLQHNGLLLGLSTMLANPLGIMVCGLAAWVRRYPVLAYLGLGAVRGRDVALGLGCLAVLIPASDALMWLSGRPIVPEFMHDVYQTAGWRPLLITALLAGAPLGEEIFFRGFLYRGLAESWLRPLGAVLVTSAAWASIHLQYDWMGMATIFAAGLFLGWLRWRTGSTTLTILIHAVMNLVATIEAIVEIEVLR